MDELVDGLRDDLPELRHVVLAAHGDVPHDVRWSAIVDAAQPWMPDLPAEPDPCVLLYTGVLLDQRAPLAGVALKKQLRATLRQEPRRAR